MSRTGGEVIIDLVILLGKNILKFIKNIFEILKKNKRVVLSVSIIVLFVIVIVIINGVNNMRPEKALDTFLRQIEDGNINDINLTIYNSTILTPVPLNLNIKGLIKDDSTSKYVINSNQLAEHIDLLKTIKNVDLISVKKKSHIDACIYYVFKDKKGRKIFDVAMWGSNEDENTMFINGIEFIWDEIFSDIVNPFISTEYEVYNE